MRVYLDCCGLQRPFDDRSQPRIAIEAEAVLIILSLCESHHLRLIASEALLFEVGRIPDQVRKEDAWAILKIAEEIIAMGVVDTIRFLNQFSMGQGDYTEERERWLGDISLDDAISQIRAERNKA